MPEDPAPDPGRQEEPATDDHRELVAQLDGQARLLESILRATPDQFYAFDRECRYVFVSPAAARLFRRDAEDFVGRSWRDLGLPPAVMEPLEERLREVLQGSEPYRGALSVTTRDGEHHYEYALDPVLDEGGEARLVICTARDVSGRLELERQLRNAAKLEAVGRLAGGVAHDFNNLLTGIAGYTELMLASAEESSPMHADLQQVKKLTRRAGDLTRQLLIFSRRQPIEPRMVDVGALVAEVAELLDRSLGDDVRIELVPGVGLDPVSGDPGQLEEVLVNLAVNARDAMPGGGNLRLVTRTATSVPGRAGSRDRWVVLEVVDDGHGIDEATRQRIFEPFFSTKEVGKGTGLGLSTAHGIVEQHGGHIRCESTPGVGTRFEVYLPSSARPERVAEPKPDPAADTDAAILLVEDDEAVRLIAERVLERAGYRVLAAAGPEEAERIFSEVDGGIELLLTDVVMPGMDGVTLFRRLAEGSRDLKVLFMSGYARPGMSVEDAEIMRTRFIAKPFTPGVLGQRVREALQD